MTKDEKEAHLRKCGWSLWYSDDYWVHPKTVQDESVQDCTNYGLSTDAAYKFETEGSKPFPSVAPFQKAISALYQPGYKKH